MRDVREQWRAWGCIFKLAPRLGKRSAKSEFAAEASSAAARRLDHHLLVDTRNTPPRVRSTLRLSLLLHRPRGCHQVRPPGAASSAVVLTVLRATNKVIPSPFPPRKASAREPLSAAPSSFPLAGQRGTIAQSPYTDPHLICRAAVIVKPLRPASRSTTSRLSPT